MEVGGPACILKQRGSISSSDELTPTAALGSTGSHRATLCHRCVTHTFFSVLSVHLQMEGHAKANVSMLTQSSRMLRFGYDKADQDVLIDR